MLLPDEPSFLKAAVIGWPITHSLSPRLHSYWLKLYGIKGSYDALAIEPERLEKVFKTLATQGYRGVNVTVPHKEKLLDLLNSLSADIDALALKVGAVNTVIFDDQRIKGLNTDVYGFRRNLENSEYKISERPVVILGAGGASRAVIVALQELGLRNLRIINRTEGRAQELSRRFSSPECSVTFHSWNQMSQVMEGASLLINTTSISLTDPVGGTIDIRSLPKDAIVTDIVYSPLRTPLLISAEAAGYKTFDGLGMLLYQAQPAFSAFFGHKAEVTEELRHYMTEAL